MKIFYQLSFNNERLGKNEKIFFDIIFYIQSLYNWVNVDIIYLPRAISKIYY